MENEERVFGLLSYTEKKIAKNIFEELKNDEEGCLINVRQICTRVGIAHSVGRNTVCKLEMAGLIKSHSRGCIGTQIKLLSPDIINVPGEWE